MQVGQQKLWGLVRFIATPLLSFCWLLHQVCKLGGKLWHFSQYPAGSDLLVQLRKSHPFWVAGSRTCSRRSTRRQNWRGAGGGTRGGAGSLGREHWKWRGAHVALYLTPWESAELGQGLGAGGPNGVGGAGSPRGKARTPPQICERNLVAASASKPGPCVHGSRDNIGAGPVCAATSAHEPKVSMNSVAATKVT